VSSLKKQLDVGESRAMLMLMSSVGRNDSASPGSQIDMTANWSSWKNRDASCSITWSMYALAEFQAMAVEYREGEYGF